MRGDLAPFALDLAMALGGLGLLVAFRIVPLRASSMVAGLGLAYLTGAAAIPLAMTILVIIGVPFNLTTFAIVTLICIAIGVWFGWRPAAERPTAPEPWWRRPWRSWPADYWVVGLFILGFGAFAVVGMLDAYKVPILGWDSWSFYGRKAEMLTWHDSLFHAFFVAPVYSLTRHDYPMQLPVFEALHFRAAGKVDIQAIDRHLWLLLVGFVWGAAYLLRDKVRPLVWAPLLLLGALAPGVWIQLLEGNADIPMAMFAGMGAIALALWVGTGRDGGGRYLALATVMLAAAGNTKNEGLMAALALLIVAGVIGLVRGLRMRDFLIAAGVFVATELPWRIWMSAHGIESELPLTKGLDPGYMLGRTSRIWPAIRTVGHELSDQSRWLYLLPLAAVVVLAALISGIGRRVAAFYAAGFLLVTAGFIWIYWLGPYPIGWYVENSADRIISVMLFICVAALVHVSGLLLTALMSRERLVDVEAEEPPEHRRLRLGSPAR
jgi:hypothetical protein